MTFYTPPRQDTNDNYDEYDGSFESLLLDLTFCMAMLCPAHIPSWFLASST